MARAAASAGQLASLRVAYPRVTFVSAEVGDVVTSTHRNEAGRVIWQHIYQKFVVPGRRGTFSLRTQ